MRHLEFKNVLLLHAIFVIAQSEFFIVVFTHLFIHSPSFFYLDIAKHPFKHLSYKNITSFFNVYDTLYDHFSLTRFKVYLRHSIVSHLISRSPTRRLSFYTLDDKPFHCLSYLLHLNDFLYLSFWTRRSFSFCFRLDFWVPTDLFSLHPRSVDWIKLKPSNPCSSDRQTYLPWRRYHFSLRFPWP